MDTLIRNIIQWLMRLRGFDRLTAMKTMRKPRGGWKGRCRPSEISAALRRFGLKCRNTHALTKRVVDTEIRKGNPILIGVEGELLGFEEDHWMVIHGTSRSEVLLANNLYPGKSS